MVPKIMILHHHPTPKAPTEGDYKITDMNNPNNLRLHERPFLEFMAMFPVMLAVFPVPAAFPVAMALGLIYKPENWPIAAIYFVWLIFGIIIIYLNEKD